MCSLDEPHAARGVKYCAHKKADHFARARHRARIASNDIDTPFSTAVYGRYNNNIETEHAGFWIYVAPLHQPPNQLSIAMKLPVTSRSAPAMM